MLSHDSCCTLPYSSLVTWNALVREAGLEPDSATLTVAMVVDGTSATGANFSTGIGGAIVPRRLLSFTFRFQVYAHFF
jgi:hypothetical protein